MGRKNTVVNLKDVTQKISLNCTLKMNDAHLIKQAAMTGLGIVQLHHYMVEKELENGTLVEVLKHATQPEIPLYIYYQKNRIVQPKVREFVNLVFG
ncbi:MAG: LysR substrate-binding domain-containing protein [Coxiellaceae bacterium]|nr:LysR substrate-binding domain-containing protein [Coxiellaceae bacterium]